MANPFPDMHPEHAAVLEALTERMSYLDLRAKVNHENPDLDLAPSRVLGILNNFQRSRLADNRNGIWMRSEAGDRLAAKVSSDL
jgi:hypothetical protein